MSEQVAEVVAPPGARTPAKRTPRKAPEPTPEPTEQPPEQEPEAEAEPDQEDQEEEPTQWPAEHAWWIVVRHSVDGALDDGATLARIESCRVCGAMVDQAAYEDHLVWHARRG